MTTAYTSLLGLALPVTGELSGTWGDTVNNSITSLLDTSVAGTTNVSTDTDVTLTTTTGAANTARQAILLFSGARTALRTVTAPAQSKVYTVINATTGGFSVKLVGAGPTTGVTIVAGESAVCAWNGSDFVKVSNTGGTASFVDLTVSGNLTLSGGTANGVAYLNGSKVVTSGSALTFDGTTLGTSGLTVSTNRAQFKGNTSTGFTGGSVEIGYTGTVGIVNAYDRTASAYKNLEIYGNDIYNYVKGSNAIWDIAGVGETMRLTSTGLGIGTSSPVANTPLTLQASSGYTDILWLKSVGTNIDTRINIAPTGTGVAQVNNTNGTPIAFQISGTEQMRLTSTGLGIGTSTIGARLTTQASANTYPSGALQINSLSGTYKSYITNVGGLLLLSNNSTTDQLILDSSGNLGLGVTPSAWTSAYKALQVTPRVAIWGDTAQSILSHNIYTDGTDKYIGNGFATLFTQINGAYKFFTAPSGTAGNAITFTQAMTLDASGNLLVGATSVAGSERLNIVGGTGIRVNEDAVGTKILTLRSDYAGLGPAINVTTSHPLLFLTANTERARIDASGNLYVLSSVDGVVSASSLAAGTSNNIFLGKYSATTTTNGTTCYAVRTNGNVINTNNSYGAISDAKLKENIVDATPKLADLMQVKVRNYNMIGDTTKQIGVVAQELETVFPSMVDVSFDTDEEGNNLGTTTKSVKYSVFVPMLIKALQEQQAIIESLTQRIATLEAK